ncbi:phosphodiesterase [Sphingomonas sp. Leaf33]|uniref:alkaline phosphatase family protein n=1 Tax=Sphingomonas sp. Leaf33 TaxID=1736215 RepID=UPI0006F61C31|nr:ectonucleotide pyrophosphatase/phosphodiesterase [Sphingomonas sp. Leaf33]KQN26711.1 phosphodiesterase [Sphingomonas sp. Leaf33]
MRIPVLLACLSAASLGACAVTPPPGATVAPPDLSPLAAPVEARAPVTILISIDGFRPDYLDRSITPHLSQLASDGVRAAMRPSFPSKTFPNHWAIVTGLRPDRNGIVSNTIEDPSGKRDKFTMATDDPWWWNAAPPLWVDAEAAGIRSAAMFWPGASVAYGGTREDDWPNDIVGGVRPNDWIPYGEAVDETQRVDTIIDWLRRPLATRPAFLTLYFEEVDTAGHRYGPDDARTNAAIAKVDRAIGYLTTQLATLNQPANIIVVSDHGMAPVTKDQVIALADLASDTDSRAVETGVFASFQPLPGREAALAASLSRPRDHVRCWPKAQIPARLHYGRNPRVPAWFCLADPGWRILAKPASRPNGGEHGYDNDVPDMRAIFIASGPAFARQKALPVFDNVDVYALIRRVIGLPQVGGKDATLEPVAGALR